MSESHSSDFYLDCPYCGSQPKIRKTNLALKAVKISCLTNSRECASMTIWGIDSYDALCRWNGLIREIKQKEK